MLKKILAYTSSIIWICFIGIFAFQIFSEAFFKIPVIILPQPGDQLKDGQADFYWNYVVGVSQKKQRFRLQIADNLAFKNILKTEEASENHARVQDIFKQKGPFYYRLRLEAEGKSYHWSKPIKIYGQGER